MGKVRNESEIKGGAILEEPVVDGLHPFVA